MNLSGLLSGGAVRRRTAIVFAALLAGLAFAAASASDSGAATSGQLEIWGEKGSDPGQFQFPLTLGVDATEGSVFVSDAPQLFGEVRVQKFSEEGDLEGSVTIPTPGEESFVGIAVDSVEHRFYLLQYKEHADPENNREAAEQILVFSTVPNGSGELVPPAGGPATLPVPDPTGEEPLDRTREMVVDPSTHDLEISAENREGELILQRIHTSGTGAIGSRFTDTAHTFEGFTTAFTVGPLGETIILRTKPSETGAAATRAFTLPANLSGSPAAIPGFAQAAEAEGWGLPAEIDGPEGEGFPGFGNQIALSADGNTLYWKEQASLLPNSVTEPGSYLIRGYSVSGHKTVAEYGGNETELECTVQTKTAALATVGENLDVLDQGPLNLSQEEQLYGANVIRFGPGGSLCPNSSAEFELAVTRSGSGTGMVTSSPAGINCGVTCSAEFPENEVVTLTEVPGNGSTFAGWSGACTGTGNCEVTLSEAKAVGAKFDAATVQKFKLSVSKAGTGSGTVASSPLGINCGLLCEAEFEAGKLVGLTATPASGSTFAGWGGACSGTGPCSVTMSAAKAVTATFTANTPPVNNPPATPLPAPSPKPIPKSIVCKKGFKKQKVKGKTKCVKIKKHAKRGSKGK